MSAKPDRLAVGSILWSKLVFLVDSIEGVPIPAMGIDNESDQVS